MAAQKRYKKQFCQDLIKHMKKGHSFASFPAIAGVSRTALYKWVDKYPEFSKAKEEAEAAALYMFEEQAIKKVTGKKTRTAYAVDTTMLIFMMKTRFHKIYGDVQKHEIGNGKIEIKIDSDDEKL